MTEDCCSILLVMPGLYLFTLLVCGVHTRVLFKRSERHVHTAVDANCSDTQPCTDTQHARCIESTCVCIHPFSLDEDDMKCKLPVGHNCIGRGSLCKAGTVCEVLGNTCVFKIGNKCADKETHCESGSVCDVNQTCRVSKGASCSGSRSSFCQRGTVCDGIGQCKVGTGSACTTTGQSEECVAGAACVESVCTCNTSVSVPNGLLCDAKEGRAQGPCSSILPCKLPHTHCRDGRCDCEAGLTLNSRDYSCEGTPLPSEKKPDAVNLAAVIGILTPLIILPASFYGTLVCIRRAQRHRETEQLHHSTQNRAHPPDKPTTSTTGKVPSPKKKRKHSPRKKPKHAIAARGRGISEEGSRVDAKKAHSTQSKQPQARSPDADSMHSSGTSVDGNQDFLASMSISNEVDSLMSILMGSEKSNASQVPEAAAEMPTSSETPKAASAMPKAETQMSKASEMPKAATKMSKASEMPKAAAEMPTSSETPKAASAMPKASEMPRESEMPKAATQMSKAPEMPKASEMLKAATQMSKAPEMPTAATKMSKATKMPKASEMPKAEAPQAAGVPQANGSPAIPAMA